MRFVARPITSTHSCRISFGLPSCERRCADQQGQLARPHPVAYYGASITCGLACSSSSGATRGIRTAPSARRWSRPAPTRGATPSTRGRAIPSRASTVATSSRSSGSTTILASAGSPSRALVVRRGPVPVPGRERRPPAHRRLPRLRGGPARLLHVAPQAQPARQSCSSTTSRCARRGSASFGCGRSFGGSIPRSRSRTASGWAFWRSERARPRPSAASRPSAIATSRTSDGSSHGSAMRSRCRGVHHDSRSSARPRGGAEASWHASWPARTRRSRLSSANAAGQVAALDAQREAIFRSTSWKLAAPVRLVGRLAPPATRRAGPRASPGRGSARAAGASIPAGSGSGGGAGPGRHPCPTAGTGGASAPPPGTFVRALLGDPGWTITFPARRAARRLDRHADHEQGRVHLRLP